MSLRKAVIHLKEMDDSSSQALDEAIKNFRATHPQIDSAMRQRDTINACVGCMNYLADKSMLRTTVSIDEFTNTMFEFFGIDGEQYSEEHREFRALLERFGNEPEEDDDNPT